MKLSSPSSSSAASTASTAAASFGCLATMLRSLLCFNGLPTHPSDQIKDTEVGSVDFDKLGNSVTEKKVAAAAAAPGLVARLMGLDSMPTNSRSITRSRSMDYDSLREVEGQHRRVKTSLSSREFPTFLEHEDYFILSFDNSPENMEFGWEVNKAEAKLKRRKGERRRGECKNDKENRDNTRIKCKPSRKEKVEDESRILRPTNKCDRNSHIPAEGLNVLKPLNLRENSNGAKQGKVEAECSSENSRESSPVSVLDFRGSKSILDPKVPESEEEDARLLTSSNSRRKLSAKLESFDQSVPFKHSNSTSNLQKRKNIDGKCGGSKRDCWQSENYGATWEEICTIADEDMKGLNWVYRERELWKLKLEDIADNIGSEFELQILEELMDEVVDELVETCHQKVLIC
ncbi:uncharacterized protein LOC127797783 [Diospyros lotus]|uniref:uncharacterized protein LOC127797783 n=1 Tax=Diospyros lotus TaxID=55363 RepID=UPI0022520AA0|nr:uncharacterized protein LOC127797783 [Diospyros lotus]